MIPQALWEKYLLEITHIPSEISPEGIHPQINVTFCYCTTLVFQNATQTCKQGLVSLLQISFLEPILRELKSLNIWTSTKEGLGEKQWY